ncbi:alpha/beta hydrolase [Nostocoides veronense]|uniref:Alpha/beta hydrolase n=1 Tax=Nostocoides veronense TaxID=330836 RepID=A0ABN2LC86_9MICO
MPETAPPGPVVRHVYGAHPSQVTDLHLPPADSVGGAAPVCVVIHGGFWRARYGMELGTPLAVDLAGHGVAALNVEYRRVGDGGGWPRTCEDVASAVDALAELDATVVGRLDLSRVVALGHSAGGHLAGWLAGRPALPVGAPGSHPRVRLTGAVLQAGVLDLEGAIADDLGAGAVRAFLDPDGRGERASYDLASPIRLLPTGIRTVLVHGDRDQDVPISQSRAYAAAARATGDDCHLIELPGADHYGVITVDSPDWAVCRSAVLDLLDARHAPLA